MRTDNVDELATAMASAVRVTDTSRNLLSARARTNYNWAYALMRIVFLIILGAGFLGIKLLAVDNTANLGMHPDLVTDRDRVGSCDHGSRPEPDPERIFCTSSDDACCLE